MKRKRSLGERFPPSDPCGCDVCLAYCRRPGWWSVSECSKAIQAGHAPRMMLELSPDRSFGVVSPAFAGNEGDFALQKHAAAGCTFLREGRCQLHGTGFQPLECRHCHHDRPGAGPLVHAALERDWMTPAGQAVVERWARVTGLWERRGWKPGAGG